MSNYIMRLDDAAEKMDTVKWNQMEILLDKYNIKPIVGVIPNCKDPMMEIYEKDSLFWQRVHSWKDKGWTIALHGYEHVYCTKDGGINPVNNRSEFAGLTIEEQRKKIRSGRNILLSHGFDPKVFFAPSHTFDANTIEALKSESSIRIISDTVANKPYSSNGMTFIPQQSGIVRKLPFSVVTFCYHPNTMDDKMFDKLELFLKKNSNSFIEFPLANVDRQFSIVDRVLRQLYFSRKRNEGE